MSSRIEKGGARFKPSIVPRRSAAGAAAAGSQTSSVTSTPQPSTLKQQAAGSSAGPPPSPSLAPTRQTITPSIRKNVPITASRTDAAASQAATTPARSQSYAFNVSPSVISKPGSSPAARTSITAGQPSASSAKPKPVFNRPSVSKPRPGSRASLTPAPHSQQQVASTSTQPSDTPASVDTLAAINEGAEADPVLSAPSAHSDAPPSIGGSRSTRTANTSSIRAGVGRGSTSTAAVPAIEAQAETTIDKASQPDPFQAPQRATRSRVAPSANATDAAATVKESASQQEAQPSTSRTRRGTASAPQASAPHPTATPSTASNKGKARETADQSNAAAASRSRSTLQPVKPGSQPRETIVEETPEQKAAKAAERRQNAAARLNKRRLKRKELASGKPRRPLSAYLLFVNANRANRQAQNPDMSLTELTSQIAAEWRDLAPEQRTKWEAEAALLRQQYDSALEAWRLAHPEGVTLGPEDESDMETTSEIGDDGEPIRRKKRRVTASRKPHTVSDDEEEYRKQMYEEGPQLAASRIDPANVTMADISTVDYRKGRAGPRTFEADRVYKRLVNDRRAAARSAVLGEHVLGEKVNNASPSPAPAARILKTTNGVPVEAGAEDVPEGEEEVVGDQTGDDDDDDASEVDESAPDTDADGTTDGEGGPSLSSRLGRKKRETSVAATDVSFRENRFAVQTRIVDGKIVLDETSLFANYGNGEDDRDNMEVVDEREGDRFVNAATYSRKLGRNRKWSADETAKFYRSLQQWGTDFEMIARLFPGRDRVMIKKKFNVEEKSNARLVDEALKNSIPVNLEAYAAAIGVDLSGPPPEIKADLQDIEALTAANTGDATAAIKKREASAPVGGRRGERSDVEDGDDDDGYEYEEVVEIGDDGNEQVIRRRLGKKPGGKGKKRRNSTRKGSMSTPAPPPVPVAGEADASHVAAAEASTTESRGRTVGPPSIGSKKGTRSSTRKRAGSNKDSSREAPGDGMEVEEIVGES